MTNMTNNLLDQLQYLLRENAPIDFAPNVGAEILDQVEEFLSRFVVYPDEHARRAHTLWIAHTWFMDVWYATPRLLFLSPEAGSGKTRALMLTKQLVPYPDAVGDLTAAALFTSIDEGLRRHGARPTVLFDELDTTFGCHGNSRSAEQMRRMIDIGFDRTATVSRMGARNKSMGRKTERFSPFAAMALAGKMWVDDVPATIRTRSVTIKMQRRAPHETVERWNRQTHPQEAEELCDLLQFWAEFVHEQAHHHRPDIPDGIADRDADCWEALLSVADLAGGHWPARARDTAVTTVTTSGVVTEPSDGILLLWEVKAAFDRLKADRLFTEDLLDALAETGKFRWASAAPREASMKMAKLLSHYGVAPATQRIGDKRLKGYRREDFASAWARYPEVVTVVTGASDE